MLSLPDMSSHNFLRLLLTVLVCIAICAEQSKAQSILVIRGFISDDSTKAPIAGATILVDQSQEVVLAGPQGQFTLRQIPKRPLVITVSSVGYATQSLKILQQAQRDTIRVFLHRKTLLLTEAVVQGHLQTIEVDIDKTTIDAHRYKGDQAASADNLLKIIPGLSIDAQSNISLKGDANVQLLVDGKPTLMGSREFVNWLRSQPVSSLKSVEILSPGSARLDAENTGGALNIVLQKPLVDGYKGNATLGIGTRFNHQASGYLMVKKGNVTASLNAGLYTHPNGNVFSAERTGISPEGNSYRLSQNGTRTAHDYSVNLGANVSWEIDTTLLVSSKLFLNSFHLNSENNIHYLNYTNGIIDENFDLRQFRSLDNTDVSASLSVDKMYGRGRKLVIDFLYNYHAELVDNSLYTSDVFQGTDLLQTYKNEGALQVRWEQPISKNSKVEFGAKQVARLNQAEYPVIIPPGSGNDIIRFNQYASALYGLHNVKLGPVKLQYGIRGEYLLNNFLALQETDYNKQYFNLFPSLSLFKSTADGGGLRLSYVRKTRRPGISYLNAFVDRRDPKNIAVGNTALNPEFKDVFDLSLTVIKKHVNFTGSIYYRRTRDAILAYLAPVAGNTVLYTYANASNEATVGVSPSLTLDLAKFNFNASFDFSYYQASYHPLNLMNDGFMAGVNASMSYRFNKKWYADLTGSYDTQRILLNGKATGWNVVGLTVQRNIKDRYLVSLRAQDLFNTSRFITRYFTDSFVSTTDYRPQVQAFIVSATYRFGKKFKYNDGKSSLQLDDGAEHGNR